MKKFRNAAIVLMTAVMLFAGAGCGGGESVPEGFKRVQFRYSGDEYSSPRYIELVNTYNATQGQEDKVYVSPLYSGADYSHNLTTTLSGRFNQSQIMLINDKYFKNYAVQDFFVNLDDLLADESTLTKDENGEPVFDLADIPAGLVDRYRVDVETRLAGAGTDLYGIPNGDNPETFYYNPTLISQAGINIVSVAESELASYNEANGTDFMPHGYAEYAADPTNGTGELVSSQNLAGKTVYKVFNPLIPMNWEELVFFSKYFTPEYNENAPADARYGFVSEWWFFMGWSVGGDCIGYDDDLGQYVFTLGDTNPNYLVTKDGTHVNDSAYDAGDILNYADKTYVAENRSEFTALIADETLYALPSTYEAFKEYCSLSMDTTQEVDKGDMGYGVSPSPVDLSQSSYSAYFTAGQVAIVNLAYSQGNGLNSTKFDSFGACMSAQYREYEGGSLDESGNLKVIGQSYSDGEYTGALKQVNETVAVGRNSTGSITYSFVIPKNSGDEDEYLAAWKFIQWAAGPEGQAILAESNTVIPNQSSLALSAEFTERDSAKCRDLRAVSLMAQNTEQGDWSYLEDGEWVNVWANSLNTEVRNGTLTMSEFFEKVTSNTNSYLGRDTYKIVITTK